MSESTDESIFSEKDKKLFNEDDVEKLLIIKSSLHNRLKDEKLLEKAETSELDSESESQTSDLLKEVILQACKDSRRRMTIERLQIGHVLIDNLFEKDKLRDPNVSKELESLLETQRELSVKILEKQKVLADLQSQVDETKIQNLRTMSENRELMLSLESTNQNLKNVVENYNMQTEESSLLEALTKLKNQTRVFQYILQNLVTGSGINWAEDPALLAIMLKAGKEL